MQTKIIITLLSHEREIEKTTNTGKLVLACFEGGVDQIVEARRIIWKRTEPEEGLVKVLESGVAALLYPDRDEAENRPGEGQSIAKSFSDYRHFIVLDGTWQQARKMYNQCDYLKNAPKYALKSSGESRYTLRRNQIDGGLCTAEAVVQLLREVGEKGAASALECRYLDCLESGGRELV